MKLRLRLALATFVLLAGCTSHPSSSANSGSLGIPSNAPRVSVEVEKDLEFGDRVVGVCTPASPLSTGSIHEGSVELSRLENDTSMVATFNWTAENPTVTTLGFAVWPHGSREGEPILFRQGTSPLQWKVEGPDFANLPKSFDLQVTWPRCQPPAGATVVYATNQRVHAVVVLSA